jgi:uncharacterized membrane protein YhiD involved in acid resistance
MPAVAITVTAASWLIIRSGVIAAWVGWAGIAAAAGVAVATGFLVGALAAPLIMLWVIATSVELWRTRERKAEDRHHEPLMTRTGDVTAR